MPRRASASSKFTLGRDTALDGAARGLWTCTVSLQAGGKKSWKSTNVCVSFLTTAHMVQRTYTYIKERSCLNPTWKEIAVWKQEQQSWGSLLSVCLHVSLSENR